MFKARLKVNKRYDRGSIKYDTVEDWIAGSSVLVGSRSRRCCARSCRAGRWTGDRSPARQAARTAS
ncbi:hypothetical protein [Nonomuraea sp. LPB2021202275-12-8]|uniref:hypothetical protein n=1 Tax=Nonomuraea sp. LPB2021202275-12-8 TaxID=3120159 RepID=UPI00300C5ABF